MDTATSFPTSVLVGSFELFFVYFLLSSIKCHHMYYPQLKLIESVHLRLASLRNVFGTLERLFVPSFLRRHRSEQKTSYRLSLVIPLPLYPVA